MRTSLLVAFFAFLSCKEGKEQTMTLKAKEIDNQLYRELLNYQIKNPIPKIETNDTIPTIEKSLIFIYEVKFFKMNDDTLLHISLKINGIDDFYDGKINSKINGIYEDSLIKQTYLNDPYELGNHFIKKYKKNKNNIDKYYYKRDDFIDGSYDKNVYKVRGAKLKLIEIIKGNIRPKKFS